MNEKEKAKELIKLMSKQTYRYQPYAGSHYHTEEIGYEAGKKCAIVFANETIKELNKIYCSGENDIDENIKYWKDVITELNNL